MRTRTPSVRSTSAALRSTNVVSDRLNSRAIACIRSVVRAHGIHHHGQRVPGQYGVGKDVCNEIFELESVEFQVSGHTPIMQPVISFRPVGRSPRLTPSERTLLYEYPPRFGLRKAARLARDSMAHFPIPARCACCCRCRAARVCFWG